MEDGHCERTGCVNKTREGKPFCPDHVLSHPYAAALAGELASREREVCAIEHGQPVDVDGMVASEVHQLLRDGAATVERIARERSLTHVVARAVVIALARAGLISTGSTARGAIIARLKNPPAGSSGR